MAKVRGLYKATKQGFQYKPVTGDLPPPVGPLTAVCLDIINENKNDNNKKCKYNSNDDH